MDIRAKDKTNFGWLPATHKRIINCTVKNFPDLELPQKRLEKFVQKPDFDETNVLWIFGHRHDYCKNLPNNAFDYYKKHVSLMISAIKSENKQLIWEHAGRALHFLQDMAQPLHTQKSPSFCGVIKFIEHLKFERFVRKKQAIFIENHSTITPKIRSFEELFLNTVRVSSQSEPPVAANKDKWINIGRAGINEAIDSTTEFLTKVKKMILNPQSYI